jgi:hypothetical protein
MLAETLAKRLAKVEETEQGQALFKRLRTVIDERLESLQESQLAMMTMLQRALQQ